MTKEKQGKDVVQSSEEMMRGIMEAQKTWMESFSAYVRILKGWADGVVDAKGGAVADPKKIADLWSRSCNEFLTSVVMPPLAEPMRMWLGTDAASFQFPASMVEYSKMMADFARQSMDFIAKMGEQNARAVKETFKPDMAKEFYESWLKGYEQTFGKLFPVASATAPARQMVDRYVKGIESYAKSMASLTEFYGEMIRPGVEALTEISTKGPELVQGPLTPETFDKFYQLLLHTVERRFGDLFKSPRFLQALESALRVALDFSTPLPFPGPSHGKNS